MNKQSGNMYNFVTHTWNPVRGACPHACSYCYMQRWYKNHPQPALHLDEKCLREDLGTGNNIFVGSSCDLFANEVPNIWIAKTIDHCVEYENKNKFLFQTKNPKNLFGVIYPKNTTVCVTVETNRVYPEMGKTPSPQMRINFLNLFRYRYKKIKIMLTIEPIMDFDLIDFIPLLKLVKPFQINIGADSQKSNLTEPSKDKILELISQLEKFTTVHQKKTLERLLN